MSTMPYYFTAYSTAIKISWATSWWDVFGVPDYYQAYFSVRICDEYGTCGEPIQEIDVWCSKDDDRPPVYLHGLEPATMYSIECTYKTTPTLGGSFGSRTVSTVSMATCSVSASSSLIMISIDGAVLGERHNVSIMHDSTEVFSSGYLSSSMFPVKATGLTPSTMYDVSVTCIADDCMETMFSAASGPVTTRDQAVRTRFFNWKSLSSDGIQSAQSMSSLSSSDTIITSEVLPATGYETYITPGRANGLISSLESLAAQSGKQVDLPNPVTPFSPIGAQWYNKITAALSSLNGNFQWENYVAPVSSPQSYAMVFYGSPVRAAHFNLLQDWVNSVAAEETEYEFRFSDNSWWQIISACRTKTIPDSWNIGDYKPIEIAGAQYDIVIIGKNCDTYADPRLGIAPLTFNLRMVLNISSDFHQDAPMYMYSNDIPESGLWSASYMRNNYLHNVLGFMPFTFGDAIREVSKFTASSCASGTIETTADKLFLLSESEVFGDNASLSWAGEGAQYPYFTNTDNTVKLVQTDPEEIAFNWSMRSPVKNGSNQACACLGDYRRSYALELCSYAYISFAFCF